jgi:hypothetical protein
MKHVLFLACFCLPFAVNAQVFGIFSQDEKKPVPYAHVFCAGENVLVADEKGLFFADSLLCAEFEISAVGFKRKKFAFSDALKNANRLYLSPDTIIFPETEIFSADFLKSLRKNIRKNFNRNYSGIPYRADAVFESEKFLNGVKTESKTADIVYHSEGENEKMLDRKFRYLAFDWVKFGSPDFERERVLSGSFLLSKKNIFFALIFDNDVILSEPQTVRTEEKECLKLNFKYFEGEQVSEGKVWVNTQNYAVERIELHINTRENAQKFSEKNKTETITNETRFLQFHYVRAGTHYRLGHLSGEITTDFRNEKGENEQKRTRLKFSAKKYSQEILNEAVIKSLYPELILVPYSGFYYSSGKR